MQHFWEKFALLYFDLVLQSVIWFFENFSFQIQFASSEV